MTVDRSSKRMRLSPSILAALILGGAAMIVSLGPAAASPEPGSPAGETKQPAPGGPSAPAAPPGSASQQAAPAEQEIQVPPPPLQLGLFPCSQCHSGMETNMQPRALSDPHEGMVLKHGKERWCLDCHDPKDRDHLHLVNGQLVDFEQSYRLCGQCHGDKYRDWKVGVHGKRTGSWNGRKQYLLCVNCHDPHQPRFKPLQPLPQPVRPEDIQPAKGASR